MNNLMENMEKALFGRKKRRMVLCAVIVLCMAIMAGGTAAYFTAEETAYNVITTGVLDMDLVEKTTGGADWPESGITGVMPGMVVDKIAYVENTGTIDFYTRLKVTVSVTAKDSELSDAYITLDYDTENWTEKDGYYYYNGVVSPEGKTEPLFEKVTFSKDMGNAYQNARVEILVEAEAVQSKNNADSALDAAGWDD